MDSSCKQGGAQVNGGQSQTPNTIVITILNHNLSQHSVPYKLVLVTLKTKVSSISHASKLSALFNASHPFVDLCNQDKE